MNTVDQYAKVIYLLQEMENGPAATGVLADIMEVSPANMNEMTGKPESCGPAEHEKYKGVMLTDDGIVCIHDALQIHCIIERFFSNVLDVEEFRAEAREPEPVIDGMIAERLDTIIDRDSECPDCFDPETDACKYLDVCGAEPEAETGAADWVSFTLYLPNHYLARQ